MTHKTKKRNEESVVMAWTPDIFGPIFKKNSLTLKQVRSAFFYTMYFCLLLININHFIFNFLISRTCISQFNFLGIGFARCRWADSSFGDFRSWRNNIRKRFVGEELTKFSGCFDVSKHFGLVSQFCVCINFRSFYEVNKNNFFKSHG